jgi:hypothetical protein
VRDVALQCVRPGLEFTGHERVREPFAPSLAVHAERLRLCAISVFEHLTEDEIRDDF